MLLDFEDNSDERQTRDKYPSALLPLSPTSTHQSSASKPMGQASYQPKGCTLAQSLATDGLMHQLVTSQGTHYKHVL